MTLLEALQADTTDISTAILKHALGNLVAPTLSPAVKQHQQHLRRLCEECDRKQESA